MRLWMAFLALLPACGFDAPEGTGDGGRIDGPPDAPQLCFGSFVRVCFNTLADVPTVAKNLSVGADIDTESQMQTVCDQQNDRKGDFCVIAGKGFMLPAAQVLRAHGSKPLVLISTDTMMLEATSMVDVSSTRAGPPLGRGAGANPSSCVAGMPPVMAGGGYGGSFGGNGGNGERLSGAPATSGNAAGVTPTPTMLGGGCAGGDGDSTGGIGGGGGGAVAFIATSIQLLGTVNASGAGGHGGPATKSGGGGGGSGGMIVIESPSITATGLLFANGGGGGQGGTGGGSSAIGVDGGESNAPGAGASGGMSGTEGGNGGAGSSGPSKPNGLNPPGAATGMGGGGGGGGGAGFIRGHGLPVATNIFPVAIDLP